MDKTDELMRDYIFNKHASCPLLWSKRKWNQFLKEKIEESIPLLKFDEDMNIPYDL